MSGYPVVLPGIEDVPDADPRDEALRQRIFQEEDDDDAAVRAGLMAQRGAGPFPFAAMAMDATGATQRGDGLDVPPARSPMVAGASAPRERVVTGPTGGGLPLQPEPPARSGSPNPFDVASLAGLGADRARGEAGQFIDPLLATVTTPSRPNPLRPIREEYQQSTEELGTESKAAAEQFGAARTQQADVAANAYAAEAGRQQAEIDAQERRNAVHEARRQQAVNDQRAVMAKVSEATDKVAAAPELDSRRYWNSQSAGRKFLWSIRGGLRGAGGLDPHGALNAAIDRDIEEQKSNFAQRQAVAAARGQEYGMQRSLTDDIRASIGDDVVADAAIRLMRYEQAKLVGQAEMAKAGTDIVEAEGRVFLNELDQKIAAQRMQVAELVAKTPNRIGGGTRPMLRGAIRKTVEDLRKEAAAEGRDLTKLAITEGGQAALKERDVEVARITADGNAREKAIEADGKRSETERQHSYTQRKDVTAATEAFVNEAKLIREFQKDYADEIPGIAFGMAPMQFTDEQKNAYSRLKRIVMVRLRRESGAAISDQELERDAANMLEAMDEDDVRNELANRLSEAESRIDYFERAPDEPEVEQVRRSKVAPRAPLPGGGIGVADPVAWEE